MTYGLSDGHVTDDVTWPPRVLWGSTVGYPSDSLASCSIRQTYCQHSLHRQTLLLVGSHAVSSSATVLPYFYALLTVPLVLGRSSSLIMCSQDIFSLCSECTWLFPRQFLPIVFACMLLPCSEVFFMQYLLYRDVQ